VTSDGTVGVTYYDFRNNTASAGLPTDYWMVHCHGTCINPANWLENHIAGSFDMEIAPVARGFFVGDYQGLSNAGSSFLTFFVQTNQGNIANRTDVFDMTASGIVIDGKLEFSGVPKAEILAEKVKVSSG
jgi:hypothetical protein